MSSSVLPFVRGVDFSGNYLKENGLQEKTHHMCNLRWLRMNRTNIDRLPHNVDKFSKLEILSMTHNELKSLHEMDSLSFPSLKVINVRDNQLHDSTIPADIFHLSELVTLDLSHNSLAKVPDELKDAKELIVLNLSHNKITSVPGQLFVHCSCLRHLDLSNNEIQSLPPQLRRLDQLTTLSIAHNPMEHFVFKVVDKLTNLTTLNLSNCGRDLDNTPHLDKLVNLTDINMSGNRLARIPEPVYLLDKLSRVNFSHNQIRELSSLIDTWSDLVTLDLTGNLLTSIHPHICKCTRLKRLFLSDNKITFQGIPAGVNKLSELTYFVAARNQLECIPEGLCRCYSLKSLILTSNVLVTLPEAIHYLKLENFDISDNPKLVMPPKPAVETTGAGAEFYNIDFDMKLLRQGAIQSSGKVVKTSYTKQKERYLKLQKGRRQSVTARSDNASAMKVLKGLVDIADYKQNSNADESDVMSAGAGVEAKTDEEYVPRKPKRWDEVLVRPNLDYSSIFIEDTGSLPGLTVWQIDNFYPIQLDEAFYGHFYMGDAYIVLDTFFNSSSELDWNIYFWIGRDAALDKRACSAMHAVHLRNMLGAKGRTRREEQGEESEEFEYLFDSNIVYIEGGTASGFFNVEDVDDNIYLYVLCGEHQGKLLHLESVDLKGSSLDHEHVFILVGGDKEIMVWSGGKSKLPERAKGRLIAERINKLEKKNKATITSFRAGSEPEEFWEYFGGYPTESIKAKPLIECSNKHKPVVYKAAMGQGYLELPQVEYYHGLEKKLLKSREVYIFDCHSDIYVWIGRKSPRLVRAAALRLAEELLEMISRPLVASVSRVLEGVESMNFRLWFIDWHDIIAVDYTATTKMMEKKQKDMNLFGTPEKKAAKVDLSSLFVPRNFPMTNSESEELAVYYNGLLKMMQCCVIEEKKFSILPREEKGHFYSAECYFFLCQYIIENEEDDESDDEELQTVVYFWQGQDAKNMGWLQFTLGIRKQLEKAMGSIEVIPLKQQQESFQFLSHFGGKVIIHQGKRNNKTNQYKPALYQIRANNSRLSRRIVQVPAQPKHLNSCFCHVLKVPFENSPGSGIVYVWIGSQTRTEEAIHAEQMGRTMFEPTYSNVVIKEGAEPENFFWVALGGRGEYDKEADYMKTKRLFRCSNEKGYFSVSEKTPDFCQGDLCEEDVMLLDTGKEVFLWFGSTCSEIEKKLALKSAQLYIKFLAEEDEGEETDADKEKVKRKFKFAKNGQEPWEFTRCFHGWRYK